MEQHGEYISFDINETLYFEYGQEIAEMQSISLDPDISLQTYDAYVQIRGLILLKGSYKKTNNQASENVEQSGAGVEADAYIEKIVDMDEGRAIFSHRFPMDISIPRERIEQIENVAVTINAFDYELPDEQTLKIEAVIHINGLRTEAETVTEDEQIEDQTVVQQETVETAEETIPSETEQLVQTEIDRPGIEMEQQKTAVEIETSETNDIDILLGEAEATDEEEEIKDVQFLTDLFGEESEEKQATITLYFTQEEDTIESIAKRFEIPALQLMKDNQLVGESVKAGQLLNIQRK